MKKKYLFSMLFSLLNFAVCAEQLTPEAALNRLQGGKMKVAGVSRGRMRLVHTAENSGARLYYVFRNDDNGQAVIVGADDQLPAVLAYGINDYDTTQLPPQVREWLDYYGQTCAQVISKGSPMHEVIKGNPVTPLVQTMWDQGDPYNRICVEKMHKNMPVGCVATAMAQLMNYWQTPVKGKGSHGYTATTGNYLSADFGSTTYDWAHMKDCYGTHAIEGKSETEDSPYTDEEADAVALLMYHCGVAVNMSYDEAGSGAYSSDAAAALINYFGYDKGIRQIYKAVHTDDEWQQILLGELSEGRPVMYSAHTRNNEGHSFVCDGFDGKGYFHFNWGWSGMANGYYMVVGADPLHPQYHGIGGSISSDAYDQGQSIITGIQLAKGGAQVDVTMAALNVVETSQGETSAVLYNDQQEEVSGNVMRNKQYLLAGGFFSSSVLPINADLGAILRNVETGAEYPCYGTSARSLSANRGYSYYGISLAYVPENGTYEVYPAYLPFSENGENLGGWRKMEMAVGTVPYKVTLTGTLPAFQITDVQLTQENGVVTTEPKLTVKLKALGTVSKKTLSCTLYDWTGSTIMGTCTVSSSLTMKKGDEQTIADLSFRFIKPLEEGKAYKLYFSSRSLNYELGDLNYSTYYFYVGDESLLPVQGIPEGDGASTGVQSDTYYNLQGQPVSHPHRGIYIHDGKKVLVK